MDKPDKSIIEMFVKILVVEETIATALVENEITTIEEVAYVPIDELLLIEGLNDARIQALRQRAREYLLRGSNR